jgi:acetoin utilization deacetylase AcuC-like enzyme
MFRIRKITDPNSPGNAATLRDVVALLKTRFSLAPAEDFDTLPNKLTDPLKARFRTEVFVAEDARDQLRGVAVVLYAPDLGFLYLDYMAVPTGRSGGGVGGALYQRVRDESVRLGVVGVFFECLPDDPALCRDPETLKQNAQRLRFYERFGARPIAGTLYETPVTPGQDCPPYLVYDDAGGKLPLTRDTARGVVRAILQRKYAKLCPPSYVERVVASFADDPVRLRPFRYVRPRTVEVVRAGFPPAEAIRLIVNEGHEIHHVRERGYVQAPVRIPAILRELPEAAPFLRLPTQDYGERYLRAVHENVYVDYLKRACAQVPPGKSVYPYIFPIRNTKRPPEDLPLRAGYFCIDTFTPLNANAWLAAREAVNCAMTAADAVLAGAPFAYALVRPPGHHAERRSFGGFCYFNNAAVAANYLSRYGRVAVLDIDYHHGNGTQDIFWRRADVLTLSIHGHPSFAYPYFSGFREEIGEGEGRGFNGNYPLAETITPAVYLDTLAGALRRVAHFKPAYLVVPLGYDTGVADPTGTWSNRPKDFAEIGRRIAALGLPTVIVQEGGYRTRTLGANAHGFFKGLWSGRPDPAFTARGKPSARRRSA